MRVEYVPLLQTQRELYRMPRDMKRFEQYLRTMVDESGEDLALPPLVAMNPMAREHVPELLDDYLRLDADSIARHAIAGWTNRYACEYAMKFPGDVRPGSRANRRSAWLCVPLWSSEPADGARLRQEVMSTLFRAAYQTTHGRSRTLRQMLAQERYCASCAGYCGPRMDADELDYTRQVMEPYLDCEDIPTVIACLFGDPAAESLGFRKFGLSHRAGLALCSRLAN
jgi:hypothetical protein